MATRNQQSQSVGEKSYISVKRHHQSSETEYEMDATEFLMSQHREVEDLFEQIESAGPQANKKKERLFNELAHKLKIHARIEELIFYPAAKEADNDLVLEAAEEHANVKTMIRKIEKTSPSDETFNAKITTLKEMVQHHVKEEEDEIFPKCRDVLGDDEMWQLGAQLKEKFEQLDTATH